MKTNPIITQDHKWADFGVLKGKREANEPGIDITLIYLSTDKIDNKNPLDSKLKNWLKANILHKAIFNDSILNLKLKVRK